MEQVYKILLTNLQMGKLSFLFTLFFVSNVFGQSITVDSQNYSPVALSQLLFESSCAEISNISFSSPQSVAYFNRNNSSFVLEEGFIIRNGIATHTAGSFTDTNLSSQINTNSDTFLQSLTNQSGQSLSVTDVAFFSFDFTSISNAFSFDFVFASNEYGEWQCGFSDVFAFILTDLTTNVSQNLALVPGTTSPVSVLSIRDQIHNSSCNSVNPNFFDTFYANANVPNSVMNMRGFTQLMTAFADVIPGRDYNIRMVIGDVVDADFDSAIFVSAGAFQNNLDLGDNQVLCEGTPLTINTGFDDTLYIHEWFKDGVLIVGENTETLILSEPGLYEVVLTLQGTTCVLEGAITVQSLVIQNPIPINICVNSLEDAFFDLTLNNVAQLDIENTPYTLVYFASEDDFLNNNPIVDVTNYSGTDGQLIYIGLFHTLTQTFCTTPVTFTLNIIETLVLETDVTVLVCANQTSAVNLTNFTLDILGSIDPNTVELNFYLNQPTQIDDESLILDPNNFSMQFGSNQQTLWVIVSFLNNDLCYSIGSFELQLVEIPEVSILEDVIVCEFFVLPPLTNGNYFSQPQGSGIAYQAGDIIDETMLIYIFVGPDENGCTNQSSFEVEVLIDYTLETEYCGSFIIPFEEDSLFFTAPGGFEGTGQLLAAGTEIFTSQTIYFYGLVDTEFCVEYPFDIIIYPLPLVDTLEDVVVCGGYTLPPITNGNYYTQSNGQGLMLNPGTNIPLTRTIYIFAENENCTQETSFVVTVVNNFSNVINCGSYVLPNTVIGGFYTEPAGEGTQIPSGTLINSTTTLYYFVNTTEFPNCTNNFSFTIIIVPFPEISTPEDLTICVTESPYVLPALEYGSYFTEPERGGSQLFPGDLISATTTLYVNAQNLQFGLDCQSEHSFVINIRPIPQVENFSDIYSCVGYPLPPLNFGTYYAGPNATGGEILAGTVINEEQTIYIYNEWDDLQGCNNESVFTVYPLAVFLPDFDDVLACDSYILPTLTLGNFYTEPGGNGVLLPGGTVLTSSQTVYAYVFDGTRIICEDQKSFELTISQTPILPVFQNVQICTNQGLDALDTTNYQAFYSFDPLGHTPLTESDILSLVPGTYTVYVFAFANNNSNCQSQRQFELRVFPPRILQISDAVVCVDHLTNEILQPYVVNTGLSTQLFEVDWYLNGVLIGTGPQRTLTDAGEYTVVPRMLTPETPPFCAFEPTIFTVTWVSTPVAEVVVSPDFTGFSDVMVQIISGLGTYEFQLDNGTFQSSPLFTNVATGYHTITIRDISQQCDFIVLEAIVINYPKFFTPNNDGENDFWMIRNIVFLEGVSIDIFDRYGKVITQLNANSVGWDGNYNGVPLPSTDYWFVVRYKRNNQPMLFKSHFSLRR